MPERKLKGEALRELLVNNWLTHDALWYGEVASRFGMAEASPMNLRVCRALGRIEFRRFLKATGALRPKGMPAVNDLFARAWKVFGPRAFDTEVEFRADDSLVAKTRECFAHKGMVKAKLIDEYECGIFERIYAWLDVLGLKYTVTPRPLMCMMHHEGRCFREFRFDFSAK